MQLHLGGTNAAPFPPHSLTHTRTFILVTQSITSDPHTHHEGALDKVDVSGGDGGRAHSPGHDACALLRGIQQGCKGRARYAQQGGRLRGDCHCHAAGVGALQPENISQ